MNVIVPVKATSERCTDKNFRPFYKGLSLFDIKIQQLLQAGVNEDDITIATDSQDEFEFDVIDDSGHNNTFAEALDYWLSQVSDGYESVAIVHVTTPLFDEFGKMFRTWEQLQETRRQLRPGDGYDSLVVVKPYNHFLLDDDGMPVNFNYGPWHRTSQYLPRWYTMTCATFIIDLEVARHCHYYIGKQPYLYHDTSLANVDIDTLEEFELAQLLYEYKQSSP